MRQAQIERFGGPDELHVVDADDPTAGPGEVVLTVLAAGINPLDYKIRDGSSGLAKKLTAADFPLVLGRECCGVVETLGEGVTGLAGGTRVFGMPALNHPGRCYAEKVALPADVLVPAPDGVPDAVLGGASIAGLTSWTAVHELGRVASGDVVLIHGGGGGVGQLMIQLAVAAGAEVYATGSPAKGDRIRELGATHVDYTSQDFRTATPKADVILDGVYFNTFEPSLDQLKPGGRIVALPTLADLTPAQERGIEASIPGICPDRAKLTQVGRALAEGSLTIEVDREFALAELPEAHRILESGHARGKLVAVPGR